MGKSPWSVSRSSRYEMYNLQGPDGIRTRTFVLVGVRGIEPPTFRSRSERATRLRHTPKFGRTSCVTGRFSFSRGNPIASVRFVERRGIAPLSSGLQPDARLLSYRSENPPGVPSSDSCTDRFSQMSGVGYARLKLPERYGGRMIRAQRIRTGVPCPRLESNQHLLLFRQPPSPDRLRGQSGRRLVSSRRHRHFLVFYLIVSERAPAVA